MADQPTRAFSVDEVGASDQQVAAYDGLPAGKPRYVGRFRLVRRLAAGSFGQVFLGHDPVLQRDVAIKLPWWTTMTSEEMRTRFLREGQAASQVHHPHVVHVLEAGVANGQLYIASEYCEGPNLADWLSERGNEPCDPRWSARLIAQLADATEHVHRAGIVHRDIKPRNIMLQEAVQEADETPLTAKLTDFGVAKFLHVDGEQTHTGALLGTVRYMAPEQAGGHSHLADARTDIYALGVVLYELLTGKLPSLGRDDAETMQLICQSPPRPPSAYGRVIPRDLQAICLKCLEKDPRHRYQTAAELHDDLERFLDGRPIKARPLSVHERIVRWARSNPAFAALVLVVIVAVVGTMSGILIHYRRLGQALGLAHQQQRRAEQSEQTTKDVLYAAHMRIAFQHWENQDIRALWDQLDRQQPAPGERDRRGFEWYWLQNVSHASHGLIQGHEGPIYSSVLIRDGRQLVTVGKDRIVRIWDMGSRKPVLHLAGHSSEINNVAIHPNQRLLATVDDLGTLCVWDLDDSQLIEKSNVSDQPLYGVSYSADGQFLAVGDKGGDVYVFRDKQITRQFSIATEAVDHLVFLPQGHEFAVAVGRAVEIWNAETGERVRVFEGPTDWVLKVAISGDGCLLAATGGDPNIYIWSFETGRQLAVLRGHYNSVYDIEFSPTGTKLASCGRDGTVRLWDLDVLEEDKQAAKEAPVSLSSQIAGGHKIRAWSVNFVGDDQHLVSTGHLGEIHFWSLQYENPLVFKCDEGRSLEGLCWGDGGHRLLTVDTSGRLVCWNVDSGERRVVCHPGKTPLFCIALHRQSGTIAVGDAEGVITVWNERAQPPEQRIAAFDGTSVAMIDISPDGHLLGACSQEGEVRIWELASRGPVGDKAPVCKETRDVHFMTDGQTLLTGGAFEILLLHVPSLRVIRRISFSQPICPKTITFLPSNGTLVSGHEDCDVRFWDPRTGRQISELPGHQHMIDSIAISPDERTVASSSEAGEICLWHLPSGQLMGTLAKSGDGRYFSLEFSPDGQCLAAIHRQGGDTQIEVWLTSDP